MDTIITAGGKRCCVFDYSEKQPCTLFLHPVGTGGLAEETIPLFLKRNFNQPFVYVTFEIYDWNGELSPWDAPPVFKDEAFGHGAAQTLSQLLILLDELEQQYPIQKIVLGGYSLAGLFTLWCGYQSTRFNAIGAASPSVWFPEFLCYAETHCFYAKYAALSVGDTEEKTRHPVLSQGGNALREYERLLCDHDIPCSLTFNHGNHFKDAALRTARILLAAAKGHPLSPT